MMGTKTLLLGMAILLLAFPCFTRENANIILVVDHSKSMDTNFQELQTYMEEEILTLLMKRDYLFYIQFAGTAEVLYADEIKDGESIKEIRDIIRRGTPDLAYTDIGLALETMFTTFLQVHEKINQKSVLFFITDGINEPPPTSKYYTEEYAKQDTFFELAEYRRKHPWKVMVLNIGDSRDARDLSEILDGEHILISSDLDSRILSEKIGDFLGHLELIINPDIGNFGLWARNVRFRIESTYSRDRELTITGAAVTGLKKQGKKNSNEWEEVDTVINVTKPLPLEFVITPASASRGKIHVALPGTLKNGNYKGTITFGTDETGLLLNRSFDITFSKSFPLLIIILIAVFVLVLAGGVVWILRNRGYI
jgi:hypothetical protein